MEIIEEGLANIMLLKLTHLLFSLLNLLIFSYEVESLKEILDY